MANTDNALSEADRRAAERRLEATGWGLFFIWIGVVLLSNFGWAVGLLGVGVIILATQMGRKALALKMDRFRIMVGFLFVLGGVWESFHIQVGLVPVLCIAAGLALLLSALTSKHKD